MIPLKIADTRGFCQYFLRGKKLKMNNKSKGGAFIYVFG